MTTHNDNDADTIPITSTNHRTNVMLMDEYNNSSNNNNDNGYDQDHDEAIKNPHRMVTNNVHDKDNDDDDIDFDDEEEAAAAAHCMDDRSIASCSSSSSSSYTSYSSSSNISGMSEYLDTFHHHHRHDDNNTKDNKDLLTLDAQSNRHLHIIIDDDEDDDDDDEDDDVDDMDDGTVVDNLDHETPTKIKNERKSNDTCHDAPCSKNQHHQHHQQEQQQQQHRIVLYYDSHTTTATRTEDYCINTNGKNIDETKTVQEQEQQVLDKDIIRRMYDMNIQFIHNVQTCIGPIIYSSSTNSTPTRTRSTNCNNDDGVVLPSVSGEETLLLPTTAKQHQQQQQQPLFTIEYCDISDREIRHHFKEQFNNISNDDDDDEDDTRSTNTNNTMVTSASLLLSLPAIVIDDRIMIPHNEPNWSNIVVEYLQLYIHLAKNTYPVDCNHDDDDENSDTNTFDRIMNHIENDLCNEGDDNDVYDSITDSEQQSYGKDIASVLNDTNATMTSTTIATTANNSGTTTANDSGNSSVTQLTTNLTRQTTSSRRLLSLIEGGSSMNHTNTYGHDNHWDGNVNTRAIHRRPYVSTTKPTTSIPTSSVQFSSTDALPSNGTNTNDNSSYSTLSYTVSGEVIEPKHDIETEASKLILKECTKPNTTLLSATRIIGRTVQHQPGQRLITIPVTKESITVVDLTRKLMNSTVHRYQYISQSSTASQWHNTFRGFEGLIIWKNLFGMQDMDTINNKMKSSLNCANYGNSNCSHDDDDIWIRFGLLLLSHGILHDYTPNEKDFRRTYLAVRPARNMFILNSLIRWTVPKHKTNMNDTNDRNKTMELEYSLTVLLRLSRSMDVIVEKYKHTKPQNFNQLLDAFEEAVCQLQITSINFDPKLKMVMLLNLYNMIVRHAMLVALATRRCAWIWPTSLEEMDRFLDKIGYIINGSFVSASKIRTYLFRGADTVDAKATTSISVVKSKSNRNVIWPIRSYTTNRKIANKKIANSLQVRCMSGRSLSWRKNRMEEDADYYDQKVISTDARLLMAMALGTNASPMVHTIYPEMFDQVLQESAERYCQSYVRIKYTNDTTEKCIGSSTTVILPTIFSWYRHNFGIYRENILQSIECYLSQPQRDQIRCAQQNGTLKIAFATLTSEDWHCKIKRMESSFLDIQPSVPKVTSSIRKSTTAQPNLKYSKAAIDATTCDYAVLESKEVGCTDQINSRNGSEISVSNKQTQPLKTMRSSDALKLNINSTPKIDPSFEKKQILRHDGNEITFSPELPSKNTMNTSIEQDRLEIKGKNNEILMDIKMSSGDHNTVIFDDRAINVKRTRSANEEIKPSFHFNDIYVGQLVADTADKTTVKNEKEYSFNLPDSTGTDQRNAFHSPARSGNADRDIVVTGIHTPKHDNPRNHQVTRVNCREEACRLQSTQNSEPIEKKEGTILGRSPTDVIEYDKMQKHEDDRLIAIQRWIDLAQHGPVGARQSSMGDSVLLQRSNVQPPMFARQASLGDSVPLPPIGRCNVIPIATTTPNITDETRVEYSFPKICRQQSNQGADSNCRLDESILGGQSFCFRSDVSAITYGSDFDLLRMNSLRLPHLVVPTSFASAQLTPSTPQMAMTGPPHVTTYTSTTTPQLNLTAAQTLTALPSSLPMYNPQIALPIPSATTATSSFRPVAMPPSSTNWTTYIGGTGQPVMYPYIYPNLQQQPQQQIEEFLN